MGPAGCLTFEQCPDGSEPVIWQCALSGNGARSEIEAAVYMGALPFAKAGQCQKVHKAPILASHVKALAYMSCSASMLMKG